MIFLTADFFQLKRKPKLAKIKKIDIDLYFILRDKTI